MSRLKHTVYAEALLQWHGDLFRPYLAKVGLDESVLECPDVAIPLRQYNGLLEAAAQGSDPNLGLRMGLGLLGARVSNSLLGGVGNAVRSAPDVRAMLDCASRYIVVHAQGSEVNWRLHAGRLEISYQVTDPSVSQRRQDAEFAVGTLYAMLRELTGECFAPLRVDFAHPQPADISLHREVFACPLRFGQPTNVIAWPRKILDAPLTTADPRLHRALLPGLEAERRQRLADTELTTRIGLVIEANLSDGNIGIEQVARHLCMSKRTLQRRLHELEVEFVELVAEIRQALAIELVRQPSNGLTEIAQQLGYTGASAFSRAFRRWTGMTPSVFRQQKS
ncbi:AraC family transcriptional regulator [Pseudomonas sp. UL073]|uniref:AraC family transcriptional regulator n=1 Tax=Zestomonas insulae TaxID=2809017 RepID=A0ABS2IDD2_9GAMM|nr:AraC family transcriptional regulator [Pseudomonas insulae]MBM7060299.1 AraC family transcriptional regulator [Pseudomonas insulae]